MSMVSNVQKGLLLVYFLFLKPVCMNIVHVLIIRMPFSFSFFFFFANLSNKKRNCFTYSKVLYRKLTISLQVICFFFFQSSQTTLEKA